MLGSPSFHSYRDAGNSAGKPNLEVGTGLYYEDQSYPTGQYWQNRAPVRRSLLPVKISGSCDRRESADNSTGNAKMLPYDVDDRVHNALLEELCADFGINESSYVDFLSFDLPTDRPQSGVQLPSDLEQLGEIVCFDSVKFKQEQEQSISHGIHKSDSSSHLGVRSRIAPVIATSGMQMNIPDAVASPTISSSCEESKPADGGGEALSDFPATVHSTTESAPVQPDAETAIHKEDTVKLPACANDTAVSDDYKQGMPKHTVDKQSTSIYSPSREQSRATNHSDETESSSSSPKHVAKKARFIESGGDLLEDVKKSYAFVCGADMFAPSANPVMSHPRLHSPIASQIGAPIYDRTVPLQDSTSAGYRHTYGMHNRASVRQSQSAIPNRGYADVMWQQSGDSGSTTPLKSYERQYNEAAASGPYHFSGGFNSGGGSNVMHRRNMMANDDPAFQADAGPCIQRPSISRAHSPRMSTEFVGQLDRQSGSSYQSVNQSPGLQVPHLARHYDYTVGAHTGVTHHYSRQLRYPWQNEFGTAPPVAGSYSGSSSRDYRTTGFPCKNETNNMQAYQTSHMAQNPVPANMNPSGYTRQTDSFRSPGRFVGRSRTPGVVPGDLYLQRVGNSVPVANSGIMPSFMGRDSATPTGPNDSRLLQPSTLGNKNNVNFYELPTRNESSIPRAHSGSDLYFEQQGSYPRSPGGDRPYNRMMIPHSDVAPPSVNQSYAQMQQASLAPAPETGCHSFVRHLIGSGSGPYRSHPLFPLLRDLVIADMNFEAPSFPYPLISGLPRSFDRLISNYFSCTSQSANTVSSDSSVDRIVMDALRYAHSALLDKIRRRQLKEGHHGDVPLNSFDNVCSQISDIGRHSSQDNFAAPWVDPPQHGSAASPCSADRHIAYPPPSAGVETMPPSPRHNMPSRSHILGDSPARSKAQYSVLSPTASVHNPHLPAQSGSGYMPPYNYCDLSLGSEKVNRSKVLPNEAKAIMTEWLRNHQDNPYPNDDEKDALMQSTKLTINQINYWFTNARRRLLPKWSMIRRNADEIKSSCNSPIMTP